jgi:hypothetical protein
MLLFLETSGPSLRPTQPNVQWVPGVFLSVKRWGRQVYGVPLSCVEVKNEWSFASTFLISFHGLDRGLLFKLFTISSNNRADLGT